jgi:hypothetical protein
MQSAPIIKPYPPEGRQTIYNTIIAFILDDVNIQARRAGSGESFDFAVLICAAGRGGAGLPVGNRRPLTAWAACVVKTLTILLLSTAAALGYP